MPDFPRGEWKKGQPEPDVTKLTARPVQSGSSCHLDEATARNTFFRGLAASGWHTAALTMKLLVESDFKPAGGFIGAGLEELRWPKPVRPGDELRMTVEILEVRSSRSKPHQGIAKIKTTTLNQYDKAVQIYIAQIIVLGRKKNLQP